jgi:signal transduction histidine kinase
VTVKEENQQRKLIVSVKDSGDGIDPDILPKLFSKFVTKSYHGTGLGLYICRGIIEAHGGKIWGENNIGGKGATFTFSLPLETIMSSASAAGEGHIQDDVIPQSRANLSL